jgi:hypothetical protein
MFPSLRNVPRPRRQNAKPVLLVVILPQSPTRTGISGSQLAYFLLTRKRSSTYFCSLSRMEVGKSQHWYHEARQYSYGTGYRLAGCVFGILRRCHGPNNLDSDSQALSSRSRSQVQVCPTCRKQNDHDVDHNGIQPCTTHTVTGKKYLRAL